MNEIMAVAEHIASLCTAAEALRLPVDVPVPTEPSGPYAVRPADPAELEGEGAAAIAEIATWAQSVLGLEHVPLIWRELARLPRMMAATWNKDRIVMSDGRLDAEAKACIAFAIACFKQSPYTIAQLRKNLDLDDEAVVELVAHVIQ